MYDTLAGFLYDVGKGVYGSDAAEHYNYLYRIAYLLKQPYNERNVMELAACQPDIGITTNPMGITTMRKMAAFLADHNLIFQSLIRNSQ